MDMYIWSAPLLAFLFAMVDYGIPSYSMCSYIIGCVVFKAMKKDPTRGSQPLVY